jgi:shikimate kinase
MKENLAANPADIAPGQFPAWKYPVSSIFLTGFMGAGKSTVGRELASLLQWEFVDLDDRIEQRAGKTIPEIFTLRGEPYFRQLEHHVLQTIMNARFANSIIALGGGTIAQPCNIPLLTSSQSPLVFLDAPFEELLARCGRSTNRPLFRTEQDFRALYQHRLPYYCQAHFRLHTSGKSAVELAQEIIALIGLEVTL